MNPTTIELTNITSGIGKASCQINGEKSEEITIPFVKNVTLATTAEKGTDCVEAICTIDVDPVLPNFDVNFQADGVNIGFWQVKSNLEATWVDRATSLDVNKVYSRHPEYSAKICVSKNDTRIKPELSCSITIPLPFSSISYSSLAFLENQNSGNFKKIARNSKMPDKTSWNILEILAILTLLAADLYLIKQIQKMLTNGPKNVENDDLFKIRIGKRNFFLTIWAKLKFR